MSTSALKRKKPGTGTPPLSSDDQRILDLINSKQDSGMSRSDIKYHSKIAETIVTKALKSLVAKNLIREEKPKNSSRKVFIGSEFNLSTEMSGGFWYQNGKLDSDLITNLKLVFNAHLKRVNTKVATLEMLQEVLVKRELVKGEVPIKEIGELVKSMVLDDEIMEVKSTGLGDYHGIPVGKICYRLPIAAAKTSTVGAFASIPCGMCPRISICTPHGIVSPATCVYYNKWLDVKLNPT